MSKNKFIILLVILSIPLIIYGFIQTSSQQKQEGTRYPQSASPTDTSLPSSDSSLQPTIDTPQNRLLDKIQNRRQLSSADKAATNTILSLLPKGKQSGVLYSSNNINIEYIDAANQFQVEILTPSLGLAKTQTVQWFQGKGMSMEGICNYPVSFYLNFQVSQKMKTQAASFDPLPPGC